jgi:hypothetical protein
MYLSVSGKLKSNRSSREVISSVKSRDSIPSGDVGAYLVGVLACQPLTDDLSSYDKTARGQWPHCVFKREWEAALKGKDEFTQDSKQLVLAGVRLLKNYDHGWGKRAVAQRHVRRMLQNWAAAAISSTRSGLHTKGRSEGQRLHIVQGGISNGDKASLEKAARNKLNSPSWIAPKSVNIGDDVVIYISDFGFFATAKAMSTPKARKDWPNRYGCGLTSIRLIEPPISLEMIKRHTPSLRWAAYPRSITTPTAHVASRIRDLIGKRRNKGVLDLDNNALENANIDELLKVALMRARPFASPIQRKIIFRARSQAIHKYVIKRANGNCEGCKRPAPFNKANGGPYLEPHHTTRLADDGPDHPAKVIGLCPNCHRRAHYAEDARVFNKSLIRRLAILWMRH